MRAYLIVNPRAGDARPSADELVEAARGRGLEAHVLRPGEDPAALARGSHADVLAVAGGDGSLAPVAEAALERDVPFVAVPFGTRNHFARDLGLDRDDPLRALDALEGVERRVDVGRVDDRLFLNNVSLGLYARLVHRRERHRRRGEALAGLRALWQLAGDRHHLRVRVDGDETAARVLFVGNNRYELSLFTVGERTELDGGLLYLNAASGWLPRTWTEKVAARFEVELGRPQVRAAVDGEPVLLEARRIVFESIPRALRVLVPKEGGAVHETPEPTEQEQEEAQTGRQEEEDAMRYPGHEDPDEAGERAGLDDE